MNKITALIPARGGSVGIPKKNIISINGHPLIAYSIMACKISSKIDRIIVSTDDEDIARIAKIYGAEVPFMRPKEYATNTSRDIEYLEHFFNLIPAQEAALMRPTTPLRDPATIDLAIEIYYKNKLNISSLRSINRIEQTPYKMFRLENNMIHGFFDTFEGIKNYSNLPRQIFPESYEGNGHIDIIKKETINIGDSYGNKIFGFETPKPSDIDTAKDLEKLLLQISTKEDLLTKHLEML